MLSSTTAVVHPRMITSVPRERRLLLISMHLLPPLPPLSILNHWRVSRPLITGGCLSRGSVIQAHWLLPIPLEIRPSLCVCDCFNSTNKWSENKYIGIFVSVIMASLYFVCVCVWHREYCTASILLFPFIMFIFLIVSSLLFLPLLYPIFLVF